MPHQSKTKKYKTENDNGDLLEDMFSMIKRMNNTLNELLLGDKVDIVSQEIGDEDLHSRLERLEQIMFRQLHLHSKTEYKLVHLEKKLEDFRIGADDKDD